MATRWRLQHSATVRESGQGLVEYALIVALVAVVVIAVLVLLGPALGNVFSEIKVGMQGTPSADEQELTPTPTPDHVVVSVLDAAGQGIANVRVYAFNPAGGYLGRTATTDENGDVAFELDDGRYKFRADYQRKQFWSPVIEWPREWHAIVETGQRPFAVTVADAAGGGIANVQVYAFTGSGSYISVGGRTDAGGQITFDLSDGDYKFRADYQGKQFWSAVASSPAVNAAVVETGRRPFVVTVADAAGSGITNVQVYAFTASGSYIGVGGRTDGSGQISFDLSDGDYKFRADYQGKQFWSAEINSPAVSTAAVQTGQRPFVVTVVNAAGGGIANVQVYAFTSGGGYLGAWRPDGCQRPGHVRSLGWRLQIPGGLPGPAILVVGGHLAGRRIGCHPDRAGIVSRAGGGRGRARDPECAGVCLHVGRELHRPGWPDRRRWEDRI